MPMRLSRCYSRGRSDSNTAGGRKGSGGPVAHAPLSQPAHVLGRRLSGPPPAALHLSVRSIHVGFRLSHLPAAEIKVIPVLIK